MLSEEPSSSLPSACADGSLPRATSYYTAERHPDPGSVVVARRILALSQDLGIEAVAQGLTAQEAVDLVRGHVSTVLQYVAGRAGDVGRQSHVVQMFTL